MTIHPARRGKSTWVSIQSLASGFLSTHRVSISSTLLNKSGVDADGPGPISLCVGGLVLSFANLPVLSVVGYTER